jgi:deoxyribodipyrimidine photo-lyase
MTSALPLLPAAAIAPPSRAAALAAVARVRPALYARTRNHLEGAVTGLSPWLTHGVLTLPEALAQVLARGALPVQHKLVFEFGWREYFRHVWSHLGDGILRSLHEGPQPESAYTDTLPADIREARTGVPVIDQAVRTLYMTGTLHNHARMWLASYVVHLRHVHWRAGADWMVAHLLDGDLASNHLSWQWVAGTGSHKPYLFNAENVARYAPATWHSPGTVIDRSYAALDAIARGARIDDEGPAGPASLPSGDAAMTPRHAAAGIAEPPCLTEPPADLGLTRPDAASTARLHGRTVWLTHPWALRAAPADLPADAAVIGVVLREHHAAWPWPEARWRWVDEAMAAVTTERWLVDAAGLRAALAEAASVRAAADPHLPAWLGAVARLDPAPCLFPPVARHCASFSSWWTRVTRGRSRAEELL